MISEKSQGKKNLSLYRIDEFPVCLANNALTCDRETYIPKPCEFRQRVSLAKLINELLFLITTDFKSLLKFIKSNCSNEIFFNSYYFEVLFNQSPRPIFSLLEY